MSVIAKKTSLGVVRAEWVKFWSLTSNRVLILIAVLFVPLNSLLLSTSLRQRAADTDASMLIPAVDSLAFLDSVLWLQLLVSVIAALAATSENGGRLGASFLAIPARFPVLLGKLAVVGAVSFLIGMIGALAGQALPLTLLAGSGVDYGFESGEALAVSNKAGVYLLLISVISLGAAVLLRNLVLALLTPLAMFTIVPSVLAWTAGAAGEWISGLFPTIAGRTAISPLKNPAGLDAGSGFAVMAGWALALTVGAVLAYRYRDAG